MSWSQFQTALTIEQSSALLDQSTHSLSALPLSTLRNQQALAQAAEQALVGALRRLNLPQPDGSQWSSLVAQVVARVGGLGFLDALLPPASFAYTDLLVNGNGSVWGRRKGAMAFEQLTLSPSREEVWRAVEALLSPQGRACTEATPSVDAKLPRDQALGFGGARVKVLHPAISAGDGYPSLALRLYEPAPVPPERIVEWGVLPQAVMATLLDAVANRLRVLVVGGTGTGKTTLLSALCHGIPAQSRIVKVEDPEEIWSSFNWGASLRPAAASPAPLPPPPTNSRPSSKPAPSPGPKPKARAVPST